MLLIILLIVFTVILLFLFFDVAITDGLKRKKSIDKEHKIKKIAEEVVLNLPTPVEKEITSFDLTRLTGYFFKAKKETPITVILIHGYGLSHKEMLYFADLYYNKYGFNVVAPDLRGHGESGGEYICLGIKDKEDILSWIEYLKIITFDRCKIILHGVSMGAATALMTGAYNDLSVVGIIADCPFASAKEMVRGVIKSKYRHLNRLLFFVVKFFTRLRCGYSLDEGEVKGYVKVVNCPILYIHGEQDKFITPSNSYALYENTKSPKDIYIAKEAGHAESVIKQNKEYLKRVDNFINLVNTKGGFNHI